MPKQQKAPVVINTLPIGSQYLKRMSEFENKQERRMKGRLDRYRELGKIEKEIKVDYKEEEVEDRSGSNKEKSSH